MTRNLVIAGGSVRAAAESAIRAGFAPWCADCFGDADLAAACPTTVIQDYPRQIPELLATTPPGGWMYTGALENHPEIIAAVDRPLYGPLAGVIRNVRDPAHLFSVLDERFSTPAVRRFDATSREPLPLDVYANILVTNEDAGKRWLLKPRSSAGGMGIRFWQGQAFDPDRAYLQEWIEGEPVSAVFLGEIGHTECVGQSRQLIGTAWLHALGEFQYCGSIFRISKSAEPIGEWISWTTGLLGLFGVDGIERDGQFIPVEVNPRYTASVEIMERALGRDLLRDHLRHFRPFRDEPSSIADNVRPRVAFPGKAILYAPVDFTFPAAGPWDDDYPFADLRRRFADLPHPGQAIRRGQPVLTFFADGDSPMSTEAALRKIAGDLDRLLFGR